MINFKPSKLQAAFTLLELVIVIILVSILSAYVLTRNNSKDTYQQDSVIEQIISAGRLAQQLHMNDTSRSFLLSIQTNSVDLVEYSGGLPGSSVSPGSINFPRNFGSDATLSPITTITFDRIGGVNSLVSINVAVSGVTNRNVCFETSGYIHQC